jgi:hypothetical protein
VSERRWESLALGSLLILGWIAYGCLLDIAPFGADDLRVLFWEQVSPAASAPLGDAIGWPMWRPLADYAGWIYYHAFQMSHLPERHLINLLLWTGSVWLGWRIAYKTTGFSAAPLAGATLTLVDPRVIPAVMVLEPTGSLACFLGMCALSLALQPPAAMLDRRHAVSVALLLVGSALSKEYGLAFAGTIAVVAALQRKRSITIAAVCAVAVYAVMRVAMGRIVPPSAAYCSEQGYFFDIRTVCFDHVGWDVAKQATYNIVSSGINTILPGMFGNLGAFAVDPRVVILSVPWIVFAVIGARSQPLIGRAAALMLVFQSALSFMVYRDRDQIVALCAIGTCAAIGSAVVFDRVRRLRASVAIGASVSVALIALIGARTSLVREYSADEVASARQLDPCEALAGPWPLDPAFVTRVKEAYRLRDGCASGR